MQLAAKRGRRSYEARLWLIPVVATANDIDGKRVVRRPNKGVESCKFISVVREQINRQGKVRQHAVICCT